MNNKNNKKIILSILRFTFFSTILILTGCRKNPTSSINSIAPNSSITSSLIISSSDNTSEISQNTYSISFQLNGHGKAIETLNNLTKIPENLPFPQDEEYVFEGWYTKDGTNEDYGELVKANTPLTSNITLYAKWSLSLIENTKEIIIKDLGFENEKEISSILIDSNANLQLSFSSSNNSKSGIAKYYDNGSSIRCYQNKGSTITLSINGIIKNATFTFTNSNGGELLDKNSNKISSDVPIVIDSNTASFSVNSKGTTGQIRISKLSITYQASSSNDTNKVLIEHTISTLNDYNEITKNNVKLIENILSSCLQYISSYLEEGGNISNIENYDTYTSYKEKYDIFIQAKENAKKEANASINYVDEYIKTEELSSISTLSDLQYSELNSLYYEANSYCTNYYNLYGDYSDLNSRNNITLAYSLLNAYFNLMDKEITTTYIYDNVAKYDNYYRQWGATYTERILTSGMFIENTPFVKMHYSFASIQNSLSLNCPIVQDTLITIDTPDSIINNFSVSLTQIDNQSKEIILKYYDENETLINCGSSSNFTSSKLKITSTKLPSNVSKVVIDLSNNTNNVAVTSISLNLTTKTKNIINDNYYASINDTYSGETLWTNLQTLLTDTHYYLSSYADCAYLPYIVDADLENPGNILDFYSHLSIPGTWDGGKTWNREHLWCQSRAWYGSISTTTRNAGTDLHHLRPLYQSINSSRNNSQYGEIKEDKELYEKRYLDTTYGYLNGDPTLGKGDGIFEPIDEVKGDIARILMYMLVRYKDFIDDYPLTNNVYTEESTNESCYALLLKWHELDPVDILEINRNNAIYALQGNRNPFIDHPQYAKRIWSNN